MDQDFREWIGRTEEVHDPLPFTQAQAAQAALGDTSQPIIDGMPLPLPWHWFHFLPRAPQAELDDDGHPKRGGFLPPIPLPRRMFAGARLQVHRPLMVGVPAVRLGTLRDVAHKAGKSGALAFVTVSYRFEQRGALCLEEEQDIVYREPGAPVSAPVPGPQPALPAGSTVRTVLPDSRLLFRFSALTFNAHRIHYDRDYATGVEGYPGLVVHGPLTAVLLLQLARQTTTRPIAGFSFRGQAPLFDCGPVRLAASPDVDRLSLAAHGPDGALALSAQATLG
ncbi:MAG: acyl-CoA dehydrogenase [Betaproteobacteria bacterium]